MMLFLEENVVNTAHIRRIFLGYFDVFFCLILDRETYFLICCFERVKNAQNTFENIAENLFFRNYAGYTLDIR